MLQTRVDVFELIFLVFLGLGTLVGIVVVSYIMYNAYKYRDADGIDDPYADDRPVLGELPVGGQGGKKLFLSFGLSAIIVVSLIIWTYGMLLYVEDGPDELEGDDHVQIDVEAEAFLFTYNYDYEDTEFTVIDELVIPEGEPVEVNVTATDVWHTFGISQERVKADAIPGEYHNTWFVADDAGVYENAVECFELCGDGHSGMQHDLVVIDADLFDAVVEADAMSEFRSALGADELSIDSTPDEFEAYMDAQEEDDEDDDGEENDGDEEENNDTDEEDEDE
ncbi:cytochrome c oxidase subunit II [Halovivax gelatinilyticus]|uniref:cytochrome c oxidase subunit II n=1 Tax=Halovivax gelatinilyticus TaxID=2961597 RepID=UPI0020CA7EBE|nr:cytochrome c oxidase subunit II [Halovivax gelatinilyticus]